MTRDLNEYLKDILESISNIEEYTQGISEAEFSQNQQKQDAVMRRLEIIGEAVKNLPASFCEKHPDVPWPKIAGLRDVLIHGYFGLHIKRIWKVVKEDLPELKRKLEKIGKEMNE